MKFLAVFAALVAVAFGSQTSWTLQQLSDAIQNPATDPALLPYLEQTLNEMMLALVSGQQVDTAVVATPSVDVSHWTLQELDAALANPATNPTLVPYLEAALNEIVHALMTGQQMETIVVVTPAGLIPVEISPSPVQIVSPSSVDITHWTLQEVDAALSNPATSPALKPYLEAALNQMMTALMSGQQMESTVVITPAGLIPAEGAIVPTPAVLAPTDISQWTLQEIDAALASPTTNPALVPYLEAALNEIVHALFNGQQLESVILVTPAGLLPVESEQAPAPVIIPSPMPVIPSPVESPNPAPVIIPSPMPVIPTPVEAPASAAPSSPLVQIIVNIKQQEATPVAPGAVAEVAPTPVTVVDAPTPVQVVEQAPTPVQVIEVNPEFNPIDSIHVIPQPVVVPSPVQVVEVDPAFNPIDAIHVIPEPVFVAPALVGPVV